MKDSAFISVILPTYNRAALLPRTINSVLAQTYPHWELIIWDDGSTDRTEQVVCSYADDRVHYHVGKNHGVAYARYRAVEVSRGDYLAFLDSDDEWFADKLAVQAGILNKYPQIDVLFSDFMDMIESTGEKYRTFEQYASVMSLLDVEEVDRGLFMIKSGMPGCLAVENFIATDTIMVRRRVLDELGGFTEELRIMEDFELWWRMGLEGTCFAYLNNVYLARHKPADSLSSSNLWAYENVIRGLDHCLQATQSAGRVELISALRIPYSNTWANMIPLYAAAGQWKQMLSAFFRSVKYRFTLGAIRLLVESVLNRRLLPSS